MSEANDLFIRAARMKLRIPAGNGNLSVEDLWDLELTSPRLSRVTLDGIAVELSRQVKENEGEPTSFVNPTKANSAAEVTKLQFEIVKHIIQVRLEEKAVKENAAKREATKRRLQEALENRELQELSSKSADELRAEIAAL